MTADDRDDGDRPDADLERLLEYLRESRGFDFTGYKRASLGRRITKRMQAMGIPTFSEYLEFLEVHPDEFVGLFNTILINVTSFFRDEEAWASLSSTAVPALLAQKAADSPIRIWSAGCATGQEAYTLVIALAELLGADQFRERVKIYATDADEEALARARAGAYDAHELADLPAELRERYFNAVDGRYVFTKELRHQVIFGRHDLIQDAPISRIDLLVCRNVLMYFNAETQSSILARFYFALNDNGLLFLGRAETLLSHATNFTPLDLKRRISRKVPRANVPPRGRLDRQLERGVDPSRTRSDGIALRDIAIETAAVAQILVDVDGTVVMVNERARQLFGINSDDLGRPLQDLRLSYRPVELRSLLDQVYLERRPLLVRNVEAPLPSGEPRWFDLQIAPLIDRDGILVGSSASYLDVSVTRRLQIDLEHASAELEAAYEELQSTNEELETTNEELQSTVEELETTNEELQSTNEELETMNEELHSTNEELSTINDELRERGVQLNDVNGFLESILASLQGGVAVVDLDLHVLIWNHRATELWGLREDEVIGRHLLSLDIGLPVEGLRVDIRACLQEGAQSRTAVLPAVNRRGRAITCRITCAQLLNALGDLRGMILLMEEIEHALEPPHRAVRVTH
ncbi:MAG TPA: CheR family methyltransferase [Gemmatimonadaceae bacterium]